MIHLQLDDNLSLPELGLNEANLEQAVQIALRHEQADLAAGLSLVLSNDARLQELNLQFMGIDTPTDVLSFPADLVDPDSGETYLGDILISVERAGAQAAAQGHTTAAEILLLVVHGTLHLLRHDHAEPADKLRMWAAQAAIIEEIASQTGLRPALPPE